MKRHILAVMAFGVMSFLVACGGGPNGGVGQGAFNGTACSNHQECQSQYCAALQGGGSICSNNPNAPGLGGGGGGIGGGGNTGDGGACGVDGLRKISVCHESCSQSYNNVYCAFQCYDLVLSESCAQATKEFVVCLDKTDCASSNAGTTCCVAEKKKFLGSLSLSTSALPKTVGSSCQNPSECPGNMCLKNANDYGYCSKQCNVDSDCKFGMQCTQASSAGGKVCRPPLSCHRDEIDVLRGCSSRCGQDETCIQNCFNALSSTCTDCMTRYGKCIKRSGCDAQSPECCKTERELCFGSN